MVAASGSRDAAHRAAVRRALDAAEALLPRLGRRRHSLALRLASLLGGARQTLSRRWPSSSAVARVLGMSPRRARATARAIAALEARNRLLVASLAMHGPGWIAPLLDGPHEPLPAPAILATFHVGAWPVLGAALAVQGIHTFGLGWSDLVQPDVGLDSRSQALHGALSTLRRGGQVLTAADGEAGAPLATVCLGSPLSLARGTFFLARAGDASVQPLVLLWRGQRLRLRLYDSPLTDCGPDEVAQAAALSAWLERFLREEPLQLGLGLLRRLAGEA